MNEREVAELRRRFKAEKSNISHIRGCYVNEKREIISQFEQSLGMMPENEAEKYFALLKRTLSGTRLSDGFNELKAKNALKLSLEALVIDKRFTALFTDEEANEALMRLLEVGYKF